MKRTILISALASLVAGGSAYVLRPAIEDRLDALAPREIADATSSRDARRDSTKKLERDIKAITLDEVHELVRRGDYALVDFDERFRSNLEKAHQVEITMVHGQPVASGCFPEVVTINGVGDGRLCTGTLIGPKEVLTAAHCFSGQDATANVRFGECPLTDGEVVKGTVRCFSEPRLPCEKSAIDVAIVHLEKEVAVKPRQLATANSVRGTSTLLGIGAGQDHENKSGTKRVSNFTVASPMCLGTVSLSRPFPDHLFYKCRPGIEIVAGAHDNTAYVCGGDSGGPVLKEVSPGDWQVVAIIGENHNICTTDNTFTRVETPVVLSFLKQTAVPEWAALPGNCLPRNDQNDFASLYACQ